MFSIGWQTGNVHYHLHQHRSHPYYGRSYAYQQHRYWRPRNSFGYREHPAWRHHPGNRWRTHGYRQHDRPRHQEGRDDERAQRPRERQPDAADRQRRQQPPPQRQEQPRGTRQWRAGSEPRGRAAEIRPRPGSRAFKADAPRQSARRAPGGRGPRGQRHGAACQGTGPSSRTCRRTSPFPRAGPPSPLTRLSSARLD
ncbi:MAG: hypothetical protein U5Q16_01740 [Gammaproteobacteria bacterium]|nr:hypothetical protein [Gammaproteobacteria bacterium]